MSVKYISAQDVCQARQTNSLALKIREFLLCFFSGLSSISVSKKLKNDVLERNLPRALIVPLNAHPKNLPEDLPPLPRIGGIELTSSEIGLIGF